MGCVVGCGLLGGSITPLACNTCTSNLSAMAGSSLTSQPIFFLGGRVKEEGQGKIQSGRAGTTCQLFLITWYARGANLFLVKCVIC